MPGGRPPFVPTADQRRNVEALIALGITQAEICNLVLHRDKPITEKTLRRHFRQEISQGDIKLKARIGSFMIATIEGRDPPTGMTKIESEQVRGSMLALFMRARMGWKERTVTELEGSEDKPIKIIQENDVRRQLSEALDDIAARFAAGAAQPGGTAGGGAEGGEG